MSIVLPLLIHLAATWFMTGLIWMVQIVHYPLFARVSPEAFTAYHRDHTRLITFIVGPLMLIEAASGLWLLTWLGQLAGIERAVLWTATALLLMNWLSTALVQVPLHNRLAAGFCAGSCARLVRTNWLRTIAWSTRGVLILWLATIKL